MRIMLAVALVAAFFVSAVPVNAQQRPPVPLLLVVCSSEQAADSLALVAQERSASASDAVGGICQPMPQIVPADAIKDAGATIRYLSETMTDWEGDVFVIGRIEWPNGNVHFGLFYLTLGGNAVPGREA